jgi:NAD(P)-dependent dehydrogenase (short-subunit alcohol dehydrogenase family)
VEPNTQSVRTRFSRQGTGLAESVGAAVVTGGGRGIGRAVALRLAREGAPVAVLARSAAELAETVAMIEADDGRAHAETVDVTDADAVARAFENVTAQFGPIELLVNNAGTAHALGPVWEVELDSWWGDIETSVRGAFLCTRAALAKMLERRRGRVINMVSYVAARPSPNLSGYAAGKAALVSLTEALAAETRPFGLAVFAVTPGHVRTAMVRHMLESDAGRRWLPEVGASTPLDPERAAELVAFLASGRADQLSGRLLHALDDVQALAARADEIVRDDLYVVRLRRDPL